MPTTKKKAKKKANKKTLRPGYKWIQAVSVPEEVARDFAVRCASQDLDRLQVLRTLVELYASGKLKTVDQEARKR